MFEFLLSLSRFVTKVTAYILYAAFCYTAGCVLYMTTIRFKFSVAEKEEHYLRNSK